MTTETLASIAEPSVLVSTKRRMNIDHTLRIVAAGYGKLTATMISRRQAWGPRTVLRHLAELETAGHIERNGGRGPNETAWRVTAAGKEHLQDVTNDCWATTVETQSPGSTERDHHGN